MKQLTPPDLKRCQAEKREGSFMTLGPRDMIRCPEPPTSIITEARPNHDDGQTGSMSLCAECLAIASRHFPPGYFTVASIQETP